jgi:O-antigen ligase
MLSSISLIILVILIGVAYAKKPSYGFGLLIFLSTWMKSVVGGHYVLTTMCIALSSVCCFINMSIGGTHKVKFSSEILLVLAFCSYLEIHVIYSFIQETSWRLVNQGIFYFFLFVFILLFPIMMPKRGVVEFLYKRILLGSLLFFGAILIVNEVSTPPSIRAVETTHRDIMYGVGGGHRAATLYFLGITLASIAYFLGAKRVDKRSKAYKAISYLALGVMIAALVGFQSRASAASVAVFIVVFTFLSRARLKRFWVVTVIVVSGCLVFSNVFNIADLRQRIRYEFHHLMRESRSLSFLAGIELLRENFAFGIGVGSFEETGFAVLLDAAEKIEEGYSERILKWRLYANPGTGSMHFFYLVETGLVGFALYMAIVSMVTKKIWRLRKESGGRDREGYSALFAGWLAMLVHLSFVTSEMYLLFWVIVGLAFAYDRKRYLQSLRKGSLNMEIGYESPGIN